MEKNKEEGKQKELDREESQDKQIQETGQVVLDGNSRKHKVELLTVIGEIEGHESAPSHSKTTKYEHVLPKLALIEDDEIRNSKIAFPDLSKYQLETYVYLGEDGDEMYNNYWKEVKSK